MPDLRLARTRNNYDDWEIRGLSFGASRLVEDLELSIRSYNCLIMAGFRTVGEISDTPDSELLQIKNLGKKSLAEIRSFAPRLVHQRMTLQKIAQLAIARRLKTA